MNERERRSAIPDASGRRQACLPSAVHSHQWRAHDNIQNKKKKKKAKYFAYSGFDLEFLWVIIIRPTMMLRIWMAHASGVKVSCTKKRTMISNETVSINAHTHTHK